MTSDRAPWAVMCTENIISMAATANPPLTNILLLFTFIYLQINKRQLGHRNTWTCDSLRTRRAQTNAHTWFTFIFDCFTMFVSIAGAALPVIFILNKILIFDRDLVLLRRRGTISIEMLDTFWPDWFSRRVSYCSTVRFPSHLFQCSCFRVVVRSIFVALMHYFLVCYFFDAGSILSSLASLMHAPSARSLAFFASCVETNKCTHRLLPSSTRRCKQWRLIQHAN